jgi:hypothetical protein
LRSETRFLTLHFELKLDVKNLAPAGADGVADLVLVDNDAIATVFRYLRLLLARAESPDAVQSGAAASAPAGSSLSSGHGLFQSRRSHRTGNGWLARMRAKSGCSWLIRTFRSTRATTEGTSSTGVRLSSYHRSPKARDASNVGESH